MKEYDDDDDDDVSLYPYWSACVSESYLEHYERKFVEYVYDNVGKRSESEERFGWKKELECVQTPCNACGKTYPEPVFPCPKCKCVVFCGRTCLQRFVDFTDHSEYCDAMKNLRKNRINKIQFLKLLSGLGDLPTSSAIDERRRWNSRYLRTGCGRPPDAEAVEDAKILRKRLEEHGVSCDIWPPFEKLHSEDVFNCLSAFRYLSGLRADERVDLHVYHPQTLKKDFGNRFPPSPSDRESSSNLRYDDKGRILRHGDVCYKGCLGYRFKFKLDPFLSYGYYYYLIRNDVR